MPKCENQTTIYRKLSDYRKIVIENDSFIKALDYLKGLPEKSPSQFSRIEELQKAIIPEGIKKEKTMRKEIDGCIDRAKHDGASSPFSLSIIELRYFNALGWPEVAAALFPAWRNASRIEKARYLNKLYKQHSRILSVIEKYIE